MPTPNARCRPVLAGVLGPHVPPLPKRDLTTTKKRNLLYPPGERFPVTQTGKQVAETSWGPTSRETLLCSPWCPWGKEYRWSQQQTSQATVSRLHLTWLAVEVCRDEVKLRGSGRLLSISPFLPPETTLFYPA